MRPSMVHTEVLTVATMKHGVTTDGVRKLRKGNDFSLIGGNFDMVMASVVHCR